MIEVNSATLIDTVRFEQATQHSGNSSASLIPIARQQSENLVYLKTASQWQRWAGKDGGPGIVKFEVKGSRDHVLVERPGRRFKWYDAETLGRAGRIYPCKPGDFCLLKDLRTGEHLESAVSHMTDKGFALCNIPEEDGSFWFMPTRPGGGDRPNYVGGNGEMSDLWKLGLESHVLLSRTLTSYTDIQGGIVQIGWE